MVNKPKPHYHQARRKVEYCKCGAMRINHGAWKQNVRNPAAVELAEKGVAMSTPEELSERGAVGGEKRWAGKTKAERSAFMSWMAKQPRPGARIPPEEMCECGRYSQEQAKKKNHVCGKALQLRLAVKNGR